MDTIKIKLNKGFKSEFTYTFTIFKGNPYMDWVSDKYTYNKNNSFISIETLNYKGDKYSNY